MEMQQMRMEGKEVNNLAFLVLHSSDILLAAYALKKLDERLGILEELKKMLDAPEPRVQVPAGAKLEGGV